MSFRYKVAEIWSTVIYIGYIPAAPGSFGTLFGLGIYILYAKYITELFSISKNGEILPLLLQPGIFFPFLALLLLLPSVRASTAMEKKRSVTDPGYIVIDEVLGYWLSVAFLSPSIWIFGASFLFFRLFDIVKPFPINLLQRLPYGWGVMLDDYMAAIYTNIVLWLLYLFIFPS